jgi:acetate kinase
MTRRDADDATPTPDRSGAGRSVLAVNSGSSTIKFALFVLRPDPEALRSGLEVLCRGALDQPDRATALEQVLDRISRATAEHPLAGAGHRIVHGGPAFHEPRIVTDELIEALEQLVRFAPNHLPDELALIRTMQRLRPEVPQIVCFDTGFHADLPDVARRLAIPAKYAADGVRRYGFHGLSYTFLVDALRRRVGRARADGRVVLAHLGNGSSVTAVHGGRSVDTSMGFTPLGGVVMSTRSGDLDPGVVTYIARSSGSDADGVEDELSHHSGLAGLSGGRADMRDLLARTATDAACRLAVSIYCYEIKKRIGAYAAALGGLDELVFAGGIGEHAPAVRAQICDGLQFLGVDFDEQKNALNDAIISTSTARVTVHVIPTDEEAVIARAVGHLLERRP